MSTRCMTQSRPDDGSRTSQLTGLRRVGIAANSSKAWYAGPTLRNWSSGPTSIALWLDLEVEPGVVERLDQRGGVEIAGHLEGAHPGLGRVAGHARDRLDGRLDRVAARLAAVMGARQAQALDLP